MVVVGQRVAEAAELKPAGQLRERPPAVTSAPGPQKFRNEAKFREKPRSFSNIEDG